MPRRRADRQCSDAVAVAWRPLSCCLTAAILFVCAATLFLYGQQTQQGRRGLQDPLAKFQGKMAVASPSRLPTVFDQVDTTSSPLSWPSPTTAKAPSAVAVWQDTTSTTQMPSARAHASKIEDSTRQVDVGKSLAAAGQPKRKPGQPKHTPSKNNEAASLLQCPELINADTAELLERARKGPVFSSRSIPPGAPERVYLFLINMPYSGSTALLSLLSTSSAASNLCASNEWACEGHFLLVKRHLMPSLEWKDLKNPEWPKDWNKAVKIFAQFWDMSRAVFLEKSPPNVFKVAHIAEDLQAAGKEALFIVLTRSPCYGLTKAAKELLTAFQSQPPERMLHVRYEDLIRAPYEVAQRIVDFVPQLQSLDPAKYGLATRVHGRRCTQLGESSGFHRKAASHWLILSCTDLGGADSRIKLRLLSLIGSHLCGLSVIQ